MSETSGMQGFGGRAPSHQDLLEMAANQSIQEEAPTNGGVEVVKKVNINFGCLKLNDSKKRLRGAPAQH